MHLLWPSSGEFAHKRINAGAETDQGYKRLVEEEARKLGVTGRVHWLGNLDGSSEVPDLLAVAEMLLVPSTQETFGLAVLEGWAAKRAVLFARHSALRHLADALGQNDSSLPTLEPEVWAAAIRSHLADRAKRESTAAHAHALVRDKFSWDAFAARISTLYQEVLER
jgi:glycosyltransferase involved in cell wall biosynthesis